MRGLPSATTMPTRLNDDDIILIVRLCFEHERRCEHNAREARDRNDFREAALQYQRKDQFAGLRQKLMRASHISRSTRAILEQMDAESDPSKKS
jgi:hypothetical protein